MEFDAVVIGSGFGGAVVACRLAGAGYQVLVLERGRRWTVEEFPRVLEDAWFWDQRHPEQRHGWFDFRFFPRMAVVQGAAVGGGSLHYANVSIEAKPDLFETGWPPEITYAALKPYYDRVGAMLNIQPVPPHQWAERTRLMQEAAGRLDYADRFRPLELAVSFDPQWRYDLEDPHHERHSRTFTNAYGQEQGTCIHLGYCDIGCPVKAKNTLDLNYIPLAERHGADVRPLHLVRRIEPIQGGYRLHFDRIEQGRLLPGEVTARIVVVAAGSLGSTELLLRCRDEFKTLPNLSRMLGWSWSSNGDFLTPAYHPGRAVRASRGVPIASAIDFLGDRHVEERMDFIVEDGGFPDVFAGAWEERLEALKRRRRLRWRFAGFIQDRVRALLRRRYPLENKMLWFANGRDASDGRLVLRRKLGVVGRRELHLKWNARRSERLFQSVLDMHTRLASATAGITLPNWTWLLTRDLITPHPLGGCKLGTSADDGVVSHKGEVFSYPNLYVADGAIIPTAIGNNPSKTIAALAERLAEIIVQEGK